MRELISALIREDSPDEAWTTAAATPGQVPEQQWLELIGLRRIRHWSARLISSPHRT